MLAVTSCEEMGSALFERSRFAYPELDYTAENSHQENCFTEEKTAPRIFLREDLETHQESLPQTSGTHQENTVFFGTIVLGCAVEQDSSTPAEKYQKALEDEFVKQVLPELNEAVPQYVEKFYGGDYGKFVKDFGNGQARIGSAKAFELKTPIMGVEQLLKGTTEVTMTADVEVKSKGEIYFTLRARPGEFQLDVHATGSNSVKLVLTAFHMDGDIDLSYLMPASLKSKMDIGFTATLERGYAN